MLLIFIFFWVVNLQKTPYDERCAIRIFAKTDVVMALLMEKLEMSIHNYEDSLEDDADLPRSFQMGAPNPAVGNIEMKYWDPKKFH